MRSMLVGSLCVALLAGAVSSNLIISGSESNLTQPRNVPGDFSTDFHYVDPNLRQARLNVLSALQNGLSTLVQLSRADFNRQLIPETTWSVHPYSDVALTILPLAGPGHTSAPRIPIKYAIWGIADIFHRMFDLRVFQECNATMKWRGQAVGKIMLRKKGLHPSLERSEIIRVEDVTFVRPVASKHHNESMNLGDSALHIDYHIGARILNPQQIFCGAFAGIIYAAQYIGHQRVKPFAAFAPGSINSWVGMRNPATGPRRSAPFFEMGQVVYVLEQMVQESVRSKRYMEVAGVLRIGRVPVGQMEILSGQGPGAVV